MDTQNNDGNLERLLQKWESPAPAENTLKRAVWARIEKEECHFSEGLLTRFGNTLERFFSGTKATVTTGLTMMGVSVGLAHLHADGVNESRLNEAEVAYIKSIYPLHSGVLLSE